MTDAVRAIAWAAAIVVGTAASVAALHPAHPLTAPSAAVGALASVAVALAPTAIVPLSATRE
jgi:hypothetical protein